MPSLSTILVKKLLNVFARSSFFVIKPPLLIGEIDFFEQDFPFVFHNFRVQIGKIVSFGFT